MSRFKLVFSEAVRSITANLSTSIAATMTVLIGMFLLGLFIALGTWVVSWSDHVKSELQIKVFFVDNVTPKQVNTVGDVSRHRHADQRVPLRLEGRGAQAGAQGVSQAHRRTCPSNPLPASFEVTPANADALKAISADIREQKFAGVETVKDGQQLSKRILSVARVIELVFLIAVLVLLGASVLLIANTIRLSIFSRRREIEVMKLVGATNWFVRGPFMLEGLLCGLGGRVRGGRPPHCSARRRSLPAIIPGDYTSPDVQALVVPDHRAAPARHRPRGRRARLRHDAAPLPEGLAGAWAIATADARGLSRLRPEASSTAAATLNPCPADVDRDAAGPSARAVRSATSAPAPPA